MKILRMIAAILVFSSAAVVAQTAAELLTVASISASLDSSVRLPTGSFQVINPQLTNQFADILGADKNKYEGFTLYLAQGIATKLADAYIANLANGFAAAGYFENGRINLPAPTGEIRTRSEYQNFDTNKFLMLLVVRRTDKVFFLVAKKKA